LAGRVVRGETFPRRLSLRQLDSGGELLEDVLGVFDSRNRQVAPATLDAGVRVSSGGGLAIGLGARNLIPMSFPFADGREIRFEPQVRAGFAWAPESMPWLNLALDADLTVNASGALPDARSRQLGGGVAVRRALGALTGALRGGAFTGLLFDELEVVYTAGVEIEHLGWFIAAQGHIAPERVGIEVGSGSTRFPQSLGGRVAAGWRVRF
jgi:hypothetical protein